jgi:hypothetical protein
MVPGKSTTAGSPGAPSHTNSTRLAVADPMTSSWQACGR